MIEGKFFQEMVSNETALLVLGTFNLPLGPISLECTVDFLLIDRVHLGENRPVSVELINCLDPLLQIATFAFLILSLCEESAL